MLKPGPKRKGMKMSSITERELEALRAELHSIVDSNVDALMKRIRIAS